MLRALGLVFLFAGLAGCSSTPTDSTSSESLAPGSEPAARAETFTVSQKFEVEILVFVDCANGGAGENVLLSGTLHEVDHVTIKGDRFVAKFHFQPQGISGVGEITGDKYQATGVTQDITVGGVIGVTETSVNNFKIIGQGSGNNFLVHDNFHVTVNANGTVTVLHDNFSAECK